MTAACKAKTLYRLSVSPEAAHIGGLAAAAMLEEVYTTPKPGLVDLYSNGAHKDMDVHSFEASAQALEPWLCQMAELGLCCDGSTEELFEEFRRLGIRAEEDMYRATGGVNTHKGALFTLGIFCGAASRMKHVYFTH